jgi:leucine dehydrogenase
MVAVLRYNARVKIFDTLSTLGYGELHLARSGDLQAIVAIHSTRLGPSCGGTRIRLYPSESEAIDDVTRLAQAMTCKAALAGLRHGGGKAVILAPPDLAHFSSDRRAELFRAFGRFVDTLGGRYITTEDSGTNAADMDNIRSVTKHVVGASVENGGSGDPSPFTAIGVRRGIEAIAHHVFDKRDLSGLHVAVQGVGNVGAHLARELHQAGAHLTISDVDPARRAAIAAEVGATAVEPEAILELPCDILSPCALGGAITEEIVPRLRCRAVAGAANNQLRTAAAGQALFARGIFYAPDYAINAGGLINVADEYAGYDASRARKKTLHIYETISSILIRSKSEASPPEIIADKLVEEILAAG